MRTLKPLIIGLVFTAAALAACQARSATTLAPTATARVVVVTATNPGPGAPTTVPTTGPVSPTPAATQAPTVVPTATPLPPTVVPPTATVPPTPDPNEGVGQVIYEDRLDGSSGWMWGFSDEAASFALEDGHLKGVASQGGAYWRFTLGPDGVSNGDQQVQVVAHTVACGPNDTYGLIFRAGEADGLFDLYAFQLTCGGLARFEDIDGTHAAPLVDWTSSPAIKTGPAANTLQVWMAGSEFRFYVNGQYLFSAKDDRLTSGYYGFYLEDRTAGGLTVLFDNLVARAVKATAASSN